MHPLNRGRCIFGRPMKIRGSIKAQFIQTLAWTLIIGWVSPSSLAAQSILTKPISGNFDDITIIEFLEIVENRHGIKFYYEPTKIPYYKQTFQFDQTPLFRALGSFLEGSTLDVVKYGESIVLANKLTVTAEEIQQLISNWDTGVYNKPISYEAQVLNLYFGDSLAPVNGPLTFRGSIKDKYTGDPVIGAVIQDQATGLGTSTDEDGRFELMGSAGSVVLNISYLGYQSINLSLGWYENASYDFELQVNALNLSEVVVEATALQDKVEETQIGIEALSIKEIRELPAFLGEADVLKSLEQLPGVSTAGEASSGFNVRGGNTDQNLIILDDALLFNASHALGFFSIFNADAVRSVSLYKGNIPAQYGGRLSSVLQVDLKDGNNKKWHGRGGIGLASARLVLDGPIGESTTAVVGVRSSYSNWLLRQIKKSTVKNSRVYFGDAILKITQNLGEKNTISLTGYASDDSFEFNEEFGYKWSTLLGTVKWRYLINNRYTLATSLGYGAYDSNQFVPTGENAFDLFNGISYGKFRTNLSMQNERHFINIGLEGMLLDMDPERIQPYNSSSGIKPQLISKDQGLEMGLYINDEIDILPKLSLAAGLRFSYFGVLGPTIVRTYDPEQPRNAQAIIQRRSITSKKIFESYQGLEPRLSLNWKLSEEQALKFSYNRLNQYIHLMSGTASATPVDIWQLSNPYLPQQKANNYSAGFFWNASDKWEISLEGFYKTVDDLPQFKDLATLLINEQIETAVVNGIGRSYGGEVSIAKKLGAWTGNLAYTYSRSQARSEGNFAEEIINGNDWYFSFFDQPHLLNLQFRRSPNPVQHLSISFTYKTGRPITAPVANYAVQDILITHYADRNTFRVPAYHRLDIGYTIDKSQSKTKGFTSSFTASFYNLYGRKNAYSIYFRRTENNIQRAYKLSILGSIFPSLTWNFTF